MPEKWNTELFLGQKQNNNNNNNNINNNNLKRAFRLIQEVQAHFPHASQNHGHTSCIPPFLAFLLHNIKEETRI